jgi:hypothetical protein
MTHFIGIVDEKISFIITFLDFLLILVDIGALVSAILRAVSEPRPESLAESSSRSRFREATAGDASSTCCEKEVTTVPGISVPWISDSS